MSHTCLKELLLTPSASPDPQDILNYKTPCVSEIEIVLEILLYHHPPMLNYRHTLLAWGNLFLEIITLTTLMLYVPLAQDDFYLPFLSFWVAARLMLSFKISKDFYQATNVCWSGFLRPPPWGHLRLLQCSLLATIQHLSWFLQNLQHRCLVTFCQPSWASVFTGTQGTTEGGSWWSQQMEREGPLKWLLVFTGWEPNTD